MAVVCDPGLVPFFIPNSDSQISARFFFTLSCPLPLSLVAFFLAYPLLNPFSRLSFSIVLRMLAINLYAASEFWGFFTGTGFLIAVNLLS